MNTLLTGPKNPELLQEIMISGSKSESNRLLLLQALFPDIRIENLSNSDDSRLMQAGLKSCDTLIDIHHAGTAMRFLTAYFAGREGRVTQLTGSGRMKERPVKILVEALRQLGADITYLENEGCPPLQIKGKKLVGNSLRIPANVSSQYISALMLMAPSLPEGLTIHLEGTITSIPYIRMTLGLLQRVGIKGTFEGQEIKIYPESHLAAQTVTVESDWSSASYFYSITALADPGTKISLRSFRADSLQGDSVLPKIFKHLGVETEFDGDRITLTHTGDPDISLLEWDLIEAPDLAQTIVVCCFGLGIGCNLTGLHTLKIKETDRLVALENELSKLGADITITDHSLHLRESRRIVPMQSIQTYNDHRMAMAFAPLALKTKLIIEDAGVVSKSYPDFWKDLAKLDFHASEAN